jgi:NADPH-dependent curcumin reductase CurA
LRYLKKESLMNFKNVPETLAAVVGLMIGGATASYALAPKTAPKAVHTMVQPGAAPVVTAPVHHVVKHHRKHVVAHHTAPVTAPAVVHTLSVPTENPANTLNFLQGGGGNN